MNGPGSLLRSRRAIVWMIVLALTAGVLAFVPLFDVLGFELSFVIGLVASFAAADLSATLVRRAPAGTPVPRLMASASVASLVLLVPPLLVITLNGVRVPSCDYGTGLRFYALLPGVSALLGAATGVVLASLLARAPRLSAVAPWLFILGSIALGVVRFYTAPPIFAYDPYGGWFPGALYDEDLAIGPPLVWSRVYQLTLAVAALAFAWAVQRPRLPAVVVTLLAAAGGGVLLSRSPELGFTATADDIAMALGGRVETENFVIVYPKGAPFEPEMQAIALDHELRLHEVVQVFGVAPREKITSFYFASPREKERWMGAEATYIAKPWRHEIYLSHEGFPHGSLRHEIAHVVAGEFGDPLFAVSVSWWGFPPARFNVGLIEGAAVAADWPTGARLTPHESVRAMRELGALPRLRDILAPGFLAFSSARSYTTAGSFSRFLIDSHGAERYRALYRAGGRPGDFPGIYGRTLDELEADWRAFIDTVPLPAEEREIARERFRRKGIFARPCPHAVARLHRRAADLVARGRADEALPLLREICQEDPSEPRHRLGLADTYLRAGSDVDAEAGYRALVAAGDEVTTPLRAQALLGLIDLLGRAGRLEEAAAELTRALALPVDDTTRRNLLIRREALVNEPLRAYVWVRVPGGDDPDPVVLLERAHAVGGSLGAYLAGRVLYSRGAFAEAAAQLARAAATGIGEPLVARENDRLLAGAAFLAGDLELARAAALRLAGAEQPPPVRRLGEDWLARIEFAGKAAPPR